MTEGLESVRELDLGPARAATAADATGDVRIPPEYVFFRGHFEGMPMLPGVVQLTEIVLPLVRHRHPELGPLIALRRVRFRRPVLPGEIIRVDLRGDAPDQLRFELTVGSVVVASGSMAFEGS